MNDQRRKSAAAELPAAQENAAVKSPQEKSEIQTRRLVVTLVCSACFCLVLCCANATWNAYKPLIQSRFSKSNEPVVRYPAPVVIYPKGLEYLAEPAKPMYVPKFDIDVDRVTQTLTKTVENIREERARVEERRRDMPLLDYYETKKNGVVPDQPTFIGEETSVEPVENTTRFGTPEQPPPTQAVPQQTVPSQTIPPQTPDTRSMPRQTPDAQSAPVQAPVENQVPAETAKPTQDSATRTKLTTGLTQAPKSPLNMDKNELAAWTDMRINQLLENPEKPIIEDLELLEAPEIITPEHVAQTVNTPAAGTQTVSVEEQPIQKTPSEANSKTPDETAMVLSKPELPQDETQGETQNGTLNETQGGTPARTVANTETVAPKPNGPLPENRAPEFVEPTVSIGAQVTSLDMKQPNAKSQQTSQSSNLDSNAQAANQPAAPEYFSQEEGLRIIQQFNLRAKKQLAEFTSKVHDYSCVLYKWDRTNALSQEGDVMQLQIREKPFSVYCYTKQPKKNAGREWIFWKGHYDNKIVFNTGPNNLNRTLLLEPDSPSIRNSSDHDMRDVGISGLLRQLIAVSNDLDNLRDAHVRYFSSATVGDRNCEVLEVSFDSKREGVDFHKIEIFVDQEWGFPLRLVMYDFPVTYSKDLPVLESYTYVITGMNQGLQDADFSYRNARYGFKSYVPSLSEEESQFMIRVARAAGCDKYAQPHK